MARRSPRSPKEHRREQEEEVAVREISPAERRKKLIINAGVTVLLIAFLTTSGITCVNLNQMGPAPTDPAKAQRGPEDRLVEQLDEWQGKVSKNPTDANALSNLGFFQLERATQIYATDEPNKQKDLDAALANFEAALKANPDFGFAQQQKARVFLVEKKFPEAKSAYEVLVTNSEKPVPDDDKNKEATARARKDDAAQGHLGLAAVSMAQDDEAGALGHLGKAIEADPGNAGTYGQRAMLHLKMKQKELARKDLQTAGDIYQHTGNAQQAQQVQQFVYMLDNNMLPDPDATPAAETPTPAAAPATPVKTP